MKITGKKRVYLSKAPVVILELLTLAIALYIIILPFYPELRYRFSNKMDGGEMNSDNRDINQVKILTGEILSRLNETENQQAVNRMIILKIGVDAPIAESVSADAGMAKGAWREPETSTPDQGGNTVITAHRFKYLPPSNLTFYLLDKLEQGDLIGVSWKGQPYYYRVEEIKRVEPEDVSILEASDKPILTLYTCDPIYSQKKRLVVRAALIE
ncbi:MAG: sortase [Patescibacteria group bacterium]|jgi:sortase A